MRPFTLTFSRILSLGFVVVFLLVTSCATDESKWRPKVENPAHFHKTMKAITDRIVFDIFSPPVASRIYAYSSIAAYEAGRHADSTLVSLAGQLKQMPEMPKPEHGKVYSYPLAALQALYKTGKTLIFSEDVLEQYYSDLTEELKSSGIPSDVWERSVNFGNAVSDAVIKWSSTDNYKQTRSFPKYTILKDPGTWKPTPPAYMDAVEPHWNKIRTLVIDSAAQFRTEPPTPFSTEKGSAFYKLAEEVLEVRKSLTDEQKEIASFWDCNPFMMNVNGHVMFANKKISPGGHWINITSQACIKEQLTTARSAEAYTWTAVALFEGFISCWDEKYRSRLVRPETYINTYIDEDWTPWLQTPPFPEHTSGHSTISGASSEVLTVLFGDNFAFTDSTEREFAIPDRSFTSFRHAAEEAAISRFFGGIHYRPANELGLKSGREIGNYLVSRIRTRRQQD
ncbi:MAG: vanadium-dependent haloperoxidase [Cyclobacteriaceae bacterium]